MNGFSQAKLEAEGGIKVGNSTNTQAGTIRWNPATQDFEGYDGSEWVSFTKTSSTWGSTPYSATEDLKVSASDAANGDNFGNAVAIYDDIAVIGAPLDDLSTADEGSAYVFERNSGIWSEIAKLTASDGTNGDQFGFRVDIEGDVIVIGALHDGAGSAYVFVKPGGGWTTTNETAKLTASDGVSGDRFGASVDISGDVIVVGAYYDDIAILDEGSAYVFVKPVGGWTTMTETGKLTPSDVTTQDYFGSEVAISGDVIVAGKFRTNLGGIDRGRVYVFEKPVGGWTTMTETAKLTASDGANDDYLGWSVDISGDVIVAGAYGDDLITADEGSAYIFEKPTGGWADMTETAKLTASDAGNGDFFSLSLSIQNDLILVGSYKDDLVTSDEGSAYVFEKPIGGWITMNETAKLTASDAAMSDHFGLGVDVFGNWIIVGAFGKNGSTSDEGGVYFYER